jgi:ribosomal protein S4
VSPLQRIRQTWNKYNLFNLMRMRTPFLNPKTFFQQKWVGKSWTRGYHGEHIKEYQWERMFNRRTNAAVNMDPTYMANHDGSEQATGRGTGRRNAKGELIGPRNKANRPEQTPYMQMVFAPMERRLDIAIFRALFASSARQARQFVLHGAVTVNGKKVRPREHAVPTQMDPSDR